jgi:hypothetical protein
MLDGDNTRLLQQQTGLVILVIRVDALDVAQRVCLYPTGEWLQLGLVHGVDLTLSEVLAATNLRLGYLFGKSRPLHFALLDQDDLTVADTARLLARLGGMGLLHDRGHLARVFRLRQLLFDMQDHLAGSSRCNKLLVHILYLWFGVYRVVPLEIYELLTIWIKVGVAVRVVAATSPILAFAGAVRLFALREGGGESDWLSLGLYTSLRINLTRLQDGLTHGVVSRLLRLLGESQRGAALVSLSLLICGSSLPRIIAELPLTVLGAAIRVTIFTRVPINPFMCWGVGDDLTDLATSDGACVPYGLGNIYIQGSHLLLRSLRLNSRYLLVVSRGGYDLGLWAQQQPLFWLVVNGKNTLIDFLALGKPMGGWWRHGSLIRGKRLLNLPSNEPLGVPYARVVLNKAGVLLLGW